MSDTNLEAIVGAARNRPEDVAAQIAAAYACDRSGDEALAIGFYDAAWRLGVHGAERSDFVIGYGSTLRNVGRVDEAVRVLSELLDSDPANHAARCFYGLALHSAGRESLALAELLDVALALRQESPHLTKYCRALATYRTALRHER